MKNIVGVSFIIVSVACGAYVGIYKMFVQPIMEAYKAYDAGILTGAIIVTTILKYTFACSTGIGIAYLGIKIGEYIMRD